MFRSPRPLVLCAALMSGLFAAPTTSDACWFHGAFAPRTTYRPIFPTTTYYAPTTAYYAPTTSYYAPANSCCSTPTVANYAPTTTYYAPTYYAPTTTYYAPSSSCCTTPTTVNYAPAQSTTCNYVPTTSYQQQVVNRPVTGYQAVTRYNWLTGWPVTRYRPVTTYVQSVQYQPVTTYSLQCTPNYVAPASGYQNTIPTTQPGDTNTPSLAPGTSTPQDTFRQESDASGQKTNVLKPIPDANTNGTGVQGESNDDGNSLILQDPSNRTAQANTGWRIRTAVSHESEMKPRVIPAVDSKTMKEEPAKKSPSSDGWRAAKKN